MIHLLNPLTKKYVYVGREELLAICIDRTVLYVIIRLLTESGIQSSK